jgi:hypothetical protein
LQSLSRQDIASTSRSSSLSEIEAGAFGSVRVEVLGTGELVAVKYLRRVGHHAAYQLIGVSPDLNQLLGIQLGAGKTQACTLCIALMKGKRGAVS